MSALRKIELGLMSKTEPISNPKARAMWQDEVNLGFYDERIKAYFKVFNSSQFHFVDGENIIKQPWVEVEKIEEFLGVEKIVSFSFIKTYVSHINKIYIQISKSFEFNEDKGFYCIKFPGPMCLEKSKGRTKGSGSSKKFSIPQDLLEIGQKFYKNNMVQLFDILYPGVSQVGFQNFFIF